MLGGIAVREFRGVIEARWFQGRIRSREGRAELHFLLTDRDRVLPVHLGGRTLVLPWGVRGGHTHGLPSTAWAEASGPGAGRWAGLQPEEAVVPASRALDNDVWYDVREGVRAYVVRDAQDTQVVYPLIEPATHYYRAMTGSDRAPCLVRQRI